MKETRAQRRERNIKEAYHRGRIDQIHSEIDFCNACQNHWYEDMEQLKNDVRRKTIEELEKELLSEAITISNGSNGSMRFVSVSMIKYIAKQMKEQKK